MIALIEVTVAKASKVIVKQVVGDLANKPALITKALNHAKVDLSTRDGWRLTNTKVIRLIEK
jgi:hypothetical protein